MNPDDADFWNDDEEDLRAYDSDGDDEEPAYCCGGGCAGCPDRNCVATGPWVDEEEVAAEPEADAEPENCARKGCRGCEKAPPLAKHEVEVSVEIVDPHKPPF